MIDATSLIAFTTLLTTHSETHIVVLYCELNENTYNTLKHFGCEERMGKPKFFDTMDEAYAYAEKWLKLRKKFIKLKEINKKKREININKEV